ncbi:hypothetical protein EX30DRAFT_343679 [Ascodesmis nigricans]|uniref:Uncharacterized protein n=1 Tax=Ascodesmis nigricans TaxID=341454 RepID=A0A4S2MLX7_9PEZI|nr:hypothetical protein EX30DRAFT_343679 [Ascodesmis nigricans]
MKHPHHEVEASPGSAKGLGDHRRHHAVKRDDTGKIVAHHLTRNKSRASRAQDENVFFRSMKTTHRNHQEEHTHITTTSNTNKLSRALGVAVGAKLLVSSASGCTGDLIRRPVEVVRHCTTSVRLAKREGGELDEFPASSFSGSGVAVAVCAHDVERKLLYLSTNSCWKMFVIHR